MSRIILDNATIFDGDSRRFVGHCMVEAERIVSAAEGPAPEPGPDDTVHDLTGLFLMPGLITGHLHVDLLKYGRANFAAGERLGKERPPGYQMAVGVRTARFLLESGFTGYVGAACSHNIDAQLKMAIDEDVVPGPRIRPCGHHVGTTADNNDTRRWWQDFQTPGIDVFANGRDDLRRLVREEIRCGAEIIKFYASGGQGIPQHRGRRNMSHDEIAAIVEAAHERGVPVRAHVVERDLIKECLELGVDVIDHGNQMDEEGLELLAQMDACWVPSIYLSYLRVHMWGDPDASFQETIDSLRNTVRIADDADLRIVLGDDYGVAEPIMHGRGIYARELGVYVDEIGLAPERVLRWGMVKAGELLAGRSGEVGIVKAGAAADLIVLSSDPTRDVKILEDPDRYLVDVMRNGRFHFGRLNCAQQAGDDARAPTAAALPVR